MAWIESHDNLPRHPKTLRLADLLSVSVPTAIGHLHCLWYWVLAFADDGDLTGLTPSELARAALWTGDPDLFVDALVRCGQQGHAGFLERTADRLLVHDWNDYAGRLIARRREDAARKRAVRRTSAGHPQDIRTPSSVTVPNRTIPNQTGEPPSAALPPSTGNPVWLQILLGLKGWPQDAAANVDVQEKTQASYGHLDLAGEAQKFVWYYQDSQKPTSARTTRRDWWNWLKKVQPQVEPGRHPDEVDRKEYLRRYGKYTTQPASDDAAEG